MNREHRQRWGNLVEYNKTMSHPTTHDLEACLAKWAGVDHQHTKGEH